MQISRLHICPRLSPPQASTQMPLKGVALCAEPWHVQSEMLSSSLPFGLKLRPKSCTPKPCGNGFVLSAVLDSLFHGIGSGLCMYLRKVWLSMGRTYLITLGPGQRASYSACTTPLGFKSPAPPNVNVLTRGVLLFLASTLGVHQSWF